MITITSISVFFLLILSAFFSGSETAFTAASRARLTTLKKKGDKRASLTLSILKDKEKMIGSLLLGNNLVNILATALTSSLFLVLFGEAGVAYATIIMTLLVLIFAEVLPKTFALHYATPYARTISPIIKILVIVLSPVVITVSAVVRNLLKYVGADISKVSSSSHMELMRGVIDMHQGPGDAISEQRAMLRSILDLEDVDVLDVMTHRRDVEMINLENTPQKIVKQILNSRFTRIPIYENDEKDDIIGILNARNVLAELNQQGGNASKLNFKNIASQPWFIPETRSLFSQLQGFRARQEHIAIVVDEYGSYQGVVTLEDILEEIVGEIHDEFDIEVQDIRSLKDGSVLVNGDVSVRAVNRAYEWDLPEDQEYSTIAGLLLYETKTLPKQGESYQFKNLKFTIIKRHKHKTTLVKIESNKIMEEE